ncbi:hypothetical protein [Nonomuraea insulae]|uniref:Uncharacterized protein n=1 Tax=Nonomuraea insulae TaxID=1616787 RepID=A0ABW1CI20_9ACTN
MTIASAALVALPFAGSAFADAPKAPQPTHSSPAKPQQHQEPKRETKHQEPKHQTVSLKVSVSESRVRAGSTYGVTIVAKGVSSGTATITSPEGKNYRVSLSHGRATKELALSSRTRTGTKTVTVKVADKTAKASFTVLAASRHQGR